MAPYENSLWFVETNVHPVFELAEKQPEMVNYIRPSFWSRFVELQRVMWDTNAALTARHAYDSRPITWPVLRRGINYWSKDHRQIYLLGNPFIWYASLCAIMVYGGARVLLMLRAKRGKKDFNDSTVQFYDQTAGFLTLGWAMHFLPFFAMHRQLFLHHYLPALYFSILLLAVLFDALTSVLRPKFRFAAALVMIAIAFLSYATYAPVTYATPWTKSACERSRFLKTWDLNCQDFPDQIQMYSNFGPGVHTEHHERQNNTLLGSLDSTGAFDGMAPQAGNHPFEQAPKIAAVSGDSSSLNTIAVASYANVAPQDDIIPPPVPAPRPDQDQVEGDRKAAKGEMGGVRQQEQADIQGLDQEGVEAVVLEGTASMAKPPSAPKTQMTGAAVADQTKIEGGEGEIHVQPDT